MDHQKVIVIDPGHGMGNRKSGVYDSGTESAGVQEATVAMDYANALRQILIAAGAKVVRTRKDAKDPAPVSKRAAIAKQYHGDIMISLHCNDGPPSAGGTETFYRGPANAAMAKRLNDGVRLALGTRDRGIKLEKDSQHPKGIAIMAFQPCFLIELGFLSNAADRAAMLDPAKRNAVCGAIATAIMAYD